MRATCSGRPGGHPEQPEGGEEPHASPRPPRLPQERPLCGSGPAQGARGSGLCAPRASPVRRRHQVEWKPRRGGGDGPSPPGGRTLGGRVPPGCRRPRLCSGPAAPPAGVLPSRGAGLEALARLSPESELPCEAMAPAPQGLSPSYRVALSSQPRSGAGGGRGKLSRRPWPWALRPPHTPRTPCPAA